MAVKISCGTLGPSVKVSPFLTSSPSWTVICLPLGIRYSSISPFSDKISNLLFPLKSLPNWTFPSTSEINACSLGLLASNNSATLGKPPVISLSLNSKGIRAIKSPAKTSCPSFTLRIASTGSSYEAFAPEDIFRAFPDLLVISILGLKSFILGLDFDSWEFDLQSFTLLEDIPVSSFISSWIDKPSTKSVYLIIPVFSDIIGRVYGSHSTSLSPFFTFEPSLNNNLAPLGTLFLALSLLLESSTTISASLLITTSEPFESLIIFPLTNLKVPSIALSMLDCSVCCAAPPIWNVLIVSWVPGSPIDWAAITPTASPLFTIVPLAKSLP